MKDWKLAVVVGVTTLGGVALGAWLFSGRPASAQTPPGGAAYRQCIVVRQESLDVHDDGNIEDIRTDHSLFVPRGWEVVGGGGNGDTRLGSMVLCRR